MHVNYYHVHLIANYVKIIINYVFLTRVKIRLESRESKDKGNTYVHLIVIMQ